MFAADYLLMYSKIWVWKLAFQVLFCWSCIMSCITYDCGSSCRISFSFMPFVFVSKLVTQKTVTVFISKKQTQIVAVQVSWISQVVLNWFKKRGLPVIWWWESRLFPILWNKFIFLVFHGMQTYWVSTMLLPLFVLKAKFCFTNYL